MPRSATARRRRLTRVETRKQLLVLGLGARVLLDVNGDGNGCLRQGGSAIIVLANTRRGSDGGASRRGHAP